MSKKNVMLFLLCSLLIFGYIKLFYKNYNENTVTKNADGIVVVDVKRIINSIIWEYITTPSLWKKPSSKPKTDAIIWKDMVVLPDYIFAFHIPNQPINAWYSVLQIKNEMLFNKGIQQQQFIKVDSNLYVSTKLGLQYYKNDNKILVAPLLVDIKNILSVANELFLKKQYKSKMDLENIIAKKSHVAAGFYNNIYFKDDAFFTLNFDKTNVKIEGVITPNKEYLLSEKNFNYNANNLLALGVTQPHNSIYALLSNNLKQNITKAINLNLDSLMLQSNNKYAVNIAGITTKTDSAISYTFDDDFNKVEKVIVNKVEEPSFNICIVGDSINNIYNNWVNNKKIEKTNAGLLFTPIPFAKTYCTIKSINKLELAANNYKEVEKSSDIKCVCFANILFSKIPQSYINYFPTNIAEVIKKTERMHIVVQKKDEEIIIKGTITKKKEQLPFWKM
ncbi:MAG: hypothetical protein ABL929_03235 [Ferruginibacter sp.]|nr:hypothetical protein [Ferruginibacter sp.]